MTRIFAAKWDDYGAISDLLGGSQAQMITDDEAVVKRIGRVKRVFRAAIEPALTGDGGRTGRGGTDVDVADDVLRGCYGTGRREQT